MGYVLGVLLVLVIAGIVCWKLYFCIFVDVEDDNGFGISKEEFDEVEKELSKEE